jgi:hypothetical protein
VFCYTAAASTSRFLHVDLQAPSLRCEVLASCKLALASFGSTMVAGCAASVTAG